MLVAIIAICVAIPLATAAMTASAYSNLPDRVPLGLNVDGTPRGDKAPRPMIWMVVTVQILIAAVITIAALAIAGHWPRTHGTLPGLLLVATCILALMWRVQRQLLAAAQSQDDPSMTSFWIFFGIGIAASLAGVFLMPN